MVTQAPNIKSVPTAEQLFGGKTRQLARFCEEPEWSAYNPSICYTEEHGYLVLLRSSNGWLRDHRPEWKTDVGDELNTPDSFENPGEWYQNAYINSVLGSEGLFRNKMFIAKLNPATLSLTKLQEVDLTDSYKHFPVEITRGIEDGRLYHDGKTLRISAVIYETRKIPVARICSLPLHFDDGVFRGGEIEMYESPKDAETVEKNWMPVHRTSLVNSDEVTFDFLYQSGTTFNSQTRETNFVGGPLLSVRGGSQLVGLDNGTMLGVVHQTVFSEYMRFASLSQEPIFRRKYVHRFLQYDADGRILKTTEMFNFLNKSIEFAAGIAINQNKVFVTFGALDSSAHIASIPLKNILSSLRPPKVNIQ